MELHRPSPGQRHRIGGHAVAAHLVGIPADVTVLLQRLRRELPVGQILADRVGRIVIVGLGRPGLRRPGLDQGRRDVQGRQDLATEEGRRKQGTRDEQQHEHGEPTGGRKGMRHGSEKEVGGRTEAWAQWKRYFTMHQMARTPSFQPIFLPSS